MTSRRHILNTTMAVGALVAAGVLVWSTRTSGIDVPARPEAVTVEVTAIPTADEPLPQIQVPDLVPQVAVEPGSVETRIHVPPRPELMLADLAVEAIPEPLPEVAVPDLVRPCSVRPRPVTA